MDLKWSRSIGEKALPWCGE